MVAHVVAPASSILLALQRATHISLHSLSTRLAGLDLSPGEINALANFPAAGSLKVSELAAGMGTRPSTATSILDRLEQRGHVARHPHPSDRRAVMVSLSASGRQAARTIGRELRAVEDEAIGRLSPTAVAGLRAGLQAFSQ